MSYRFAGSMPKSVTSDPAVGVTTLVTAPGLRNQIWMTDMSFYATISGVVDYNTTASLNNGVEDKYMLWHGLVTSLEAPIPLGENLPMVIVVYNTGTDTDVLVNVGYYVESINYV
jgi:hypothetical protein